MSGPIKKDAALDKITKMVKKINETRFARNRRGIDAFFNGNVNRATNGSRPTLLPGQRL